ncbi:MAG: PIN domain-containing protein [Sulfuricella sp.]
METPVFYPIKSGSPLEPEAGVSNEFAAVASRKLRMSWPEIREVLDQVRAVSIVEPMSVETHERSLVVAERYDISIYDIRFADCRCGLVIWLLDALFRRHAIRPYHSYNEIIGILEHRGRTEK